MKIDPFDRMNLVISAGAVATSCAVASPSFTVALALGAAMEAANFHALRRSAQFLFRGVLPNQRAWSAVFAMRFGLLAVGIGAALYFGANAAGLLVGLSLIMPAAILEACRTRPPVLENAKALDPDDPAWDDWNPWLARENAQPEDSDEENW
ncbi:MAG: hypothetical protein VCE43_06610 [Myxococcota bacterium]|jgi:hypothetical protein